MYILYINQVILHHPVNQLLVLIGFWGKCVKQAHNNLQAKVIEKWVEWGETSERIKDIYYDRCNVMNKSSQNFFGA